MGAFKNFPKKVSRIFLSSSFRMFPVVEQIYILYIHCTLPYLRESLKGLSGGVGGERTRSNIILGHLRTGLYTNMIVLEPQLYSITSHYMDGARTMSNMHGPSMRSCMVSIWANYTLCIHNSGMSVEPADSWFWESCVRLRL